MKKNGENEKESRKRQPNSMHLC